VLIKEKKHLLLFLIKKAKNSELTDLQIFKQIKNYLLLRIGVEHLIGKFKVFSGSESDKSLMACGHIKVVFSLY